ncbi:MAG: hypothetical protein EAZ37_05455 [Burkholderiales bacterium]|nr:MAG: hypothetical protein EAZ37_05455 [Burkholderiales bacterium]
MSYLVSFKQKVSQLVSGLHRQPDKTIPLDAIKQAMLNVLPRNGSPCNYRLHFLVMYATNTETLWHARIKLMQILAFEMGEEKARHRLEEISSMFPDKRRTQRWCQFESSLSSSVFGWLSSTQRNEL